MSRSAEPMSREIVQKIRKRFESFGINEHYFSNIAQDKCGWNSAKGGTESEPGAGGRELAHDNFSVRIGKLHVGA